MRENLMGSFFERKRILQFGEWLEHDSPIKKFIWMHVFDIVFTRQEKR